eukprot:16448595-Heterocapsa_arctica.AAC.1
MYCARSQECRPAVCAVVFVPTVFCAPWQFLPSSGPFLSVPSRSVRTFVCTTFKYSACPTSFQQPRKPLALAQK